MTPLTLEEVKKLLEGTTPGRLRVEHVTEYKQTTKDAYAVMERFLALAAYGNKNDAALAAHAPALAHRVIELEEELHSMKPIAGAPPHPISTALVNMTRRAKEAEEKLAGLREKIEYLRLHLSETHHPALDAVLELL